MKIAVSLPSRDHQGLLVEQARLGQQVRLVVERGRQGLQVEVLVQQDLLVVEQDPLVPPVSLARRDLQDLVERDPRVQPVRLVQQGQPE